MSATARAGALRRAQPRRANVLRAVHAKLETGDLQLEIEIPSVPLGTVLSAAHNDPVATTIDPAVAVWGLVGALMC